MHITDLQLDPEGIIHPVVSVSAHGLLDTVIFYWNLPFINNVIIIKTKVLLSKE